MKVLTILKAYKASSSLMAEKSHFGVQKIEKMKYQVKIGIIGGSGFYNSDFISNRIERLVPNLFGEPSDILIEGTVENVPCAMLARHGRKHTIMPSDINYRANIWALKSIGCTHIVACTACGSLKEEMKPGDIVFIDSFIDRTTKRNSTFHDNSPSSPQGICHLPMEPAFCEETRKVLMLCADKLGIAYHAHGTCVTIEGPRFSTKAESKLFRSWGCHIINMTTVPEVTLAKEAGLCYAAVALITDYDCWRDNGNYVTVEDVDALFKKNLKKIHDLIVSIVVEIGGRNWDETIDSLKGAITSNTLNGKLPD